MSDQPAAMTMLDRISDMKEWATDQIGKHAGPIAIGPGVTIVDVDKFIQKQMATMDTYKPRELMHTSAYMQLFYLKDYLETKP